MGLWLSAVLVHCHADSSAAFGAVTINLPVSSLHDGAECQQRL